MKAGADGMPGLSTSRRALYGKFTIRPNGPGTFIITTLYGLLGADTAIADGTPVTGAAADPSTVTWTIRRAPEGGSSVAPLPLQPLDYAVKYNPVSRTIRFETADDPVRLSAIPVSLYTTGGGYTHGYGPHGSLHQ